MKKDWEDNKKSFEIIDVRKMAGNFLPMILKKGDKIPVGQGICVIQSFEPIPLYSAMDDLGFEHETNKVADKEFKVYFYRSEKKESSTPTGMEVPLKPTAMVNYKMIDDTLADITVNFWKFIWEREDASIDQKTKYLLSLSNAVGANRFRQATRELIKAYAVGVTVAELDELFSLFIWNQGVGNFASEIGPSPLFGAYQLIKNLEKKGVSREDVMKELMEKFGEKNPNVGTFYKKEK